VALLLVGHRSEVLGLLHKASFILWGACFAAHLLSYLPRVWRSLRAGWSASRVERVPGSGLRAAILAASIGAGVALALVTLSPIDAWGAGRF